MHAEDIQPLNASKTCPQSPYKKTFTISNYRLAGLHLLHHIDRSLLNQIPCLSDTYNQKLNKIQQINGYYLAIWQKIISYNEEATSQKIDESHQIYKEYLEFKWKKFIQFYCYRQNMVMFPHSILMFDSHSLCLLFEQIKQVMARLQPLVSKKHGKGGSKLKIEGFLFLHKLQQLLKQIKIAVYPFKRQHEDKQIKTEYRQYLLADLSIYDQLQLSKQIFVSHSIVELGYQIDTLMKNLTNEEKQCLNKASISQSFIFEHIRQTESLSRYRLMFFYHQTMSHYCKYVSNPIELTSAIIGEFVRGEPLLKVSRQNLKQFKTVGELKQMELSIIYRFHKKIISTIVYNSQSNNVVLQKEILARFIQLVLRWIELISMNQTQFELIENLMVLLRICFKSNKSYIEQHLQIINTVLASYVHQLIQHLLNEYIQVMNKIIDYDQELTYQLLTSRRIIPTLLSQEDNIKRLIQQFCPLLELIICLYNLLQMQNKIQFIHQLVNSIDYASSTHKLSANYELKNSKLRSKKVTATIDAILDIEIQHQSFSVIKPYLSELKHVMLLLQSIKAGNNHRNINKNEHEQYSQLQQVAKYFTIERTNCVFYELKSQILLFIALFKLGYHTPSYKYGGKVVNLRNHIVNLYTRLYTNNCGSTIFLSRIGLGLVLSRRSSSQSYFVGESKQMDRAEVSYIWEKRLSRYELDEGCMQLGASENLTERLKKFIKHINNNFRQLQTSAKSYLMNLLSILQNELFDKQKEHYQHSQSVLTEHYSEHIKNSLDFKSDDQNIDKLLEIQGLFYNEMYEQAWKMLLNQKTNNQSFNAFITDLLASSNARGEILKLIRIYQMFSKMNHMFYNIENEDKNVSELLQSINHNSTLPVAEKEVRAIYRICAEQTRVQQLEYFFQRFKNDNHKKMDDEYEQFKVGLTMQGVVTSKTRKNMKQTILIQVSSRYANLHDKLKAEFQRYFLLNQPGISKLNSIQSIDGKLWIEIEENPFFVMLPQHNVSKIMMSNEDYRQNSIQKMGRNFASSLIQVYDLLNVGEKIEQRIEMEQIYINQESKSYNINPYFMLFRTIFSTHSQLKIDKKQHKNRMWLSNLLQNVGNQLKNNFSAHFLSNFNTLTQYVRTNTKTSKYSTYLELPLFMTLHQKQIFIVYFDNKMSDMCDKYFDAERQLKKQKKYKEADQLRANNMKNEVFRNHRYNFIVNGIVEREMIDLQICKTIDQSKLDWTTNHKNLKISYQLPKYENDEVKQYVYSLNFMMKCLRGAVAHKMDHNYEIIQSFNKEYPQLIDFLFMRRHLLEIKYSEMIESKNTWFKVYFSNNQIVGRIIKWLTNKQVGSPNEKVVEAHKKLNEYCTLYKNQIAKKLKEVKVKCDKCNEFLKIASQHSNLLYLLQNVAKNMAKMPKLISIQHFYFDCFLAETFKNHRQIKIFGEKVRSGEVKNHLLLSWWFYLQTIFPSLAQMLRRIKNLIEIV